MKNCQLCCLYQYLHVSFINYGHEIFKKVFTQCWGSIKNSENNNFWNIIGHLEFR